MKLFDFLNGKTSAGKFVTEAKYAEARDAQMHIAGIMLEPIKILSGKEAHERSVDFFFVTNSKAKALLLSDELSSFGYKVQIDRMRRSKQYSITGETTKMIMDELTVGKWAELMCDVGYKYDCEFDGWGSWYDDRD